MKKQSFTQFEHLCASYTEQIVACSLVVHTVQIKEEIECGVLTLPIPFGNCLLQINNQYLLLYKLKQSV